MNKNVPTIEMSSGHDIGMSNGNEVYNGSEFLIKIDRNGVDINSFLDYLKPVKKGILSDVKKFFDEIAAKLPKKRRGI